MADSTKQRMYNLGGFSITEVGEQLITWFQFTKNMEAQGTLIENGGYYIQARKPQNVLRSMSGTNQALLLQMTDNGNGQMLVQCSTGKWSDKVGAGAVGLLLFWPLAITAGVGAYMQSQLPQEVFVQINNILMGIPSMTSAGAAVASTHSNPSASSDKKTQQQFLQVECPSCHALNERKAKFCNDCGAKLPEIKILDKCPSCGKRIAPGAKFCAECGARIE